MLQATLVVLFGHVFEVWSRTRVRSVSTCMMLETVGLVVVATAAASPSCLKSASPSPQPYKPFGTRVMDGDRRIRAAIRVVDGVRHNCFGVMNDAHAHAHREQQMARACHGCANGAMNWRRRNRINNSKTTTTVLCLRSMLTININTNNTSARINANVRIIMLIRKCGRNLVRARIHIRYSSRGRTRSRTSESQSYVQSRSHHDAHHAWTFLCELVTNVRLSIL